MNPIILSILTSTISAWQAIFKIYNQRRPLDFYRSYYIKVISDMGGTADTYCDTFFSNYLTCDVRKPKKSNQGGYTINNLECIANNCHFIINTENVNFHIEVNCMKAFDMESPVDAMDTKKEECRSERNFKLFEGGQVEYADIL